MSINYQWVLDEWDRFLKISERDKVDVIDGDALKTVYRYPVPDNEVKQQLSIVQLSMETVFEGWKWPYSGHSFVQQVKEMRETIHGCIPLIARRGEIDANLKPDDPGPQIAADDLHPWVWSAAKPHWDSGNDRAAIHAAAVNINSRLRKKLGRFDVSESRAVREAFSIEDPQPDRPRLRLCSKDDPDNFKSVHVGAVNLGCGLFGAVRNPVAHLPDDEHDLTEQEALECLAAFSLFARWIDRATVEQLKE
ncbi:TIGR02391 family protein [Micromonospora zamorensis]|uniref:TIGR02391 family protein n=1 Tax=Micromonospora zamorensis TaxID=709883 RepID=UPI002E2C3122|nr:TIGR02391 family protein [Micromonospora zamorensis]WTI19076.1 TIGR02391 family protein [Micromonospora zamorensis]